MMQLKHIVLSSEEVTVLGYNAAGWTDLGNAEKYKSRTIYGWNNNPLTDGNSYYHLEHKNTAITPAKRKDIEKYRDTALISAIDSLSIEDKKELLVLVNIFAKKTGILLDNNLPTHLDTQSTIIEALNDESGNPISVSKFLRCVGYLLPNFHEQINWDEQEKDLSEKIKTKSAALLNKLDEKRPYNRERLTEFMTGNSQSLQDTILQSKRVVVDTFQENFRRYFANEDDASETPPLIPIKVTIQANVGTPSAFKNDSENIRLKQDAYITPAELRTIYKLSHEIPDEVVQHIMKSTVIFLEKDTHTFRITDSPWVDGLWETRPRGQRNQQLPAYAKRDIELWPTWLIKILNNQGKGPEQLELERGTKYDPLSPLT